MNGQNLTKEEIKAIKRGRAYRNWNKQTTLVIVAVFAWIFIAIPLGHINTAMRVIVTIVTLAVVAVEFYTLILTSWKCPECKKKLPCKSVVGGTASFCMPQLVKECPHCRADLTK